MGICADCKTQSAFLCSKIGTKEVRGAVLYPQIYFAICIYLFLYKYWRLTVQVILRRKTMRNDGFKRFFAILMGGADAWRHPAAGAVA